MPVNIWWGLWELPLSESKKHSVDLRVRWQGQGWRTFFGQSLVITFPKWLTWWLDWQVYWLANWLITVPRHSCWSTFSLWCMQGQVEGATNHVSSQGIMDNDTFSPSAHRLSPWLWQEKKISIACCGLCVCVFCFYIQIPFFCPSVVTMLQGWIEKE